MTRPLIRAWSSAARSLYKAVDFPMPPSYILINYDNLLIKHALAKRLRAAQDGRELCGGRFRVASESCGSRL